MIWTAVDEETRQVKNRRKMEGSRFGSERNGSSNRKESNVKMKGEILY